VTEFEDIRMMTAGLSPALVFRIALRGCPYLLHVVKNTDATPGSGRGALSVRFERSLLSEHSFAECLKLHIFAK
jgi:hypothetical protein